jgi:FAD/FMN-containing dehydrogenase
MELMVFLHRGEDGAVQVVVTGPVLMDSEEEARAALALLETCPGLDRASVSVPFVPATFPDLYAGVASTYPDGRRYAVDNMWTHAPAEQLLPGLHRIAETLPEAPSHMLWMNWYPEGPPGEAPPARSEAAFSVEDETYIALYGIWSDPREDRSGIAWATERMREMEPLASGIQLADENLGRRPARFVSDASLARLDALRERYDPSGIFHPWMGRVGGRPS